MSIETAIEILKAGQRSGEMKPGEELKTEREFREAAIQLISFLNL